VKLSIEEGLALILASCAIGVEVTRYKLTGDSGSGPFIYLYRTFFEALPLAYVKIKKSCELFDYYVSNRNANKAIKKTLKN
jgi:hypothetical protein